MSIKSILLIITSQVLLGVLYFYYFPQYAQLLIFVTLPLAVVCEFFRLSRHYQKSSGPMQEIISEQQTDDDGEYHNDFSKVPAGTNDTNLRPRPLNFLAIDPFKESSDALNENLKNIGLESEEGNKK